MGPTDIDTMTNVTIGKYDFDDPVFQSVSPVAIEFVKSLLLKDGMLVKMFT